MIRSNPPKPDTVSLFHLRTLHLYSLSGFAIAQPALTALVGQSVYLHDQQFGLPEMLILLALLLVVLPVLWVAIDQVCWRIAKFFHCPGRNAVIGILAGIVLLSVLRPCVSTPWLKQTGAVAFTELALAIGSAAAVAFLYDRVSWFRSWLTITSVGLVIFPGHFLWKFQEIRRAETSIDGRIQVKKPVSVVFIVFDEFSGITLFNQQNEIDAQRFPQFARLAGMSTWYRNATTVNPRTDIAVPSILSGRYPVIEHMPLASEYPGNLFQVIEATHQFEMSVFEPMTRLCPDSVHYLPKPTKTFAQKCSHLIRTVAVVYPRLIFTGDLPLDLPRIPKEWFGFSPDLTLGWEDYAAFTKGLHHYAGTEFRKFQQSHFLRCLGPAELPRFSFMHTVLPHFPWCFLPSGEQYLSEFAEGHCPAGGRGELGEDWDNDLLTVLRNEYRYRMQLGFVDRFVGQVLDRLEETNQIDECLLIVTADHGVSFRPGNSRRLPGTDNLADILSVPLFIKFPRQTEGGTDDRNVELVDLYPTITDVLGIDLSTPVDGISVLQETRRPRKTFYSQGKMSIIEPDFPQRWPAIKRQTALYGAGPIEQISSSAIRYPEWHGRPIDSFEIEDRSIPFDPFKKDTMINKYDTSNKVSLSSNLIWGCIESDGMPEKSTDIVLAIDDVVINSARISPIGRNQNEFHFLVPPKFLEGKTGKLDLFLVNMKDSRGSLIRLMPNVTPVFRD